MNINNNRELLCTNNLNKTKNNTKETRPIKQHQHRSTKDRGHINNNGSQGLPSNPKETAISATPAIVVGHKKQQEQIITTKNNKGLNDNDAIIFTRKAHFNQ